jgi:hypothetical protein
VFHTVSCIVACLFLWALVAAVLPFHSAATKRIVSLFHWKARKDRVPFWPSNQLQIARRDGNNDDDGPGGEAGPGAGAAGSGGAGLLPPVPPLHHPTPPHPHRDRRQRPRPEALGRRHDGRRYHAFPNQF